MALLICYSKGASILNVSSGPRWLLELQPSYPISTLQAEGRRNGWKRLSIKKRLKSHVTFLLTLPELRDTATCSRKGAWKIWFFKEKYSVFFLKNHIAQCSVTKDKVQNKYWETTRNLYSY